MNQRISNINSDLKENIKRTWNKMWFVRICRAIIIEFNSNRITPSPVHDKGHVSKHTNNLKKREGNQ